MSEGKQYALALIPKFAGAISMTFSGMLIYSITRKIRRKRSSVYDRLLMGMSISDMLSSFWMSMSTWPIPESTGVLWAAGNQTTCNLQGFFTHGTIASPMYNASLSFYHLFVVRYKWKNQRLQKYEWCFHFLPIVWSLSTAVAGIPLELYNNANLWCFIASTPDGSRGQNADFFRMLFFYGPLFLMIIIITVNMFLVVCHVRAVTTLAIRHSTSVTTSNSRNSPNNNENGDPSGSSDWDDDYDEDVDESNFLNGSTNNSATNNASSLTPQSNANNSFLEASERTWLQVLRGDIESSAAISRDNRYAKWRRKVAIQNIRYAIAFYWTWIPISAVRMLQIFDGQVPYWLIALASFTTPMQGLPNLLVYFYPKYIKYRKRNNEKGRLNIMRWINAGMQTSFADRRNPPNARDNEYQETEGRLRTSGKNRPCVDDSTSKAGCDTMPSGSSKQTMARDQFEMLSAITMSEVSAVVHEPKMEDKNNNLSIVESAASSSENCVRLNEEVEGYKPFKRPTAGLPSTSSITASEFEQVSEEILRQKAAVGFNNMASEITVSGFSEVDNENGSIFFSPGSLRGKIGRKVSFREDLGPNEPCADQSPKLPTRGETSTTRQSSSSFTSHEIPTLMSPPSILKTSLRPQSSDTPTSDFPPLLLAGGGGAALSTSLRSDSIPCLPKRPESQVSLVADTTSCYEVDFPLNDVQAKALSPSLFPKPLNKANRKSSIGSDSSPLVPQRQESEIDDLSDSIELPTMMKEELPIKLMIPPNQKYRKHLTGSDSSPSVPVRPVSDVESFDIDSDALPPPIKTSWKTQTQTRKLSMSSDNSPSLPKRHVSVVEDAESSDDAPHGIAVNMTQAKNAAVAGNGCNATHDLQKRSLSDAKYEGCGGVSINTQSPRQIQARKLSINSDSSPSKPIRAVSEVMSEVEAGASTAYEDEESQPELSNQKNSIKKKKTGRLNFFSLE